MTCAWPGCACPAPTSSAHCCAAPTAQSAGNPAAAPQDVGKALPRVAAVQEQRELQLLSQLDLGSKPVLLHLLRPVVREKLHSARAHSQWRAFAGGHPARQCQAG